MMERKTQGVCELVQDVLRTFHTPYSEDIIEEVFLAIENNQNWLNQYIDLSAKLRQWVVNNWVGQYTKEIILDPVVKTTKRRK